MKPRLGPASVKVIEQAVSKLFQSIREHTFGDKHPTGKRLYVAYKPELTLKGIFNAAASEEGVRPSEEILKTLLKISGSYLDAAEAKAKAKTVHAVQAFLQEAGNKGVKTDLETVLNGKLYEIMGDATRDIKRIMETESTVIRNTSIMDGIVRVNAASGIEDPTVFFVTVRDTQRCVECTRLHVQPDGVTPKLWKLSELGSGYHKKGEDTPKVGGLHPHCRCVLTTLLPGYGFNAAGKVHYVELGWNAFQAQKENLEPLKKAWGEEEETPLKYKLPSLGNKYPIHSIDYDNLGDYSNFDQPVMEKAFENTIHSPNTQRNLINFYNKIKGMVGSPHAADVKKIGVVPMEDALGMWHPTEQEIHITPKEAYHLAYGLHDMTDLDDSNVNAFGTLMHEMFHAAGHQQGVGWEYNQHPNKALEEATTEVLARHYTHEGMKNFGMDAGYRHSDSGPENPLFRYERGEVHLNRPVAYATHVQQLGRLVAHIEGLHPTPDHDEDPMRAEEDAKKLHNAVIHHALQIKKIGPADDKYKHFLHHMVSSYAENPGMVNHPYWGAINTLHDHINGRLGHFLVSDTGSEHLHQAAKQAKAGYDKGMEREARMKEIHDTAVRNMGEKP